MAAIPAFNTSPELHLRRELRRAGLTGYRVHDRSLPGKPDVVFRKWRIAVFVDGVFWHGHPDHFRFGSRSPYWDKKIAGNIQRDSVVNRQLGEMGWEVKRFWDLDIANSPAAVVSRIAGALVARGHPAAADYLSRSSVLDQGNRGLEGFVG